MSKSFQAKLNFKKFFYFFVIFGFSVLVYRGDGLVFAENASCTGAGTCCATAGYTCDGTTCQATPGACGASCTALGGGCSAGGCTTGNSCNYLGKCQADSNCTASCVSNVLGTCNKNGYPDCCAAEGLECNTLNLCQKKSCTGQGCGGATGGSSCASGLSCVGGMCVPDTSCTASCASSLGGSCNINGYPDCCDANALTCLAHVCVWQTCSGSACGGAGGSSCPTGFKCNGGIAAGICVEVPDGSCGLVDPGVGLGGECTGTGCTGNCANKLACTNGICTIDTTCLKQIDTKYHGPIIRSLPELMTKIWNVFFPLSLLFAIIFIIKAGYVLMTSQGDPQKVKEGQEDLTSAIMGTVFIILSAAILRIIINQILGGSTNF